MSATKFSPLHLVPEGRAMLSCRCLLPDGWVRVDPPAEDYDFENPGVFLPLLVGMAPYGAVVFTIAARPAFGDGTVQDWAEFLAGQNNLTIESIREARVNRMPCVLVEGTMQAEMGLMRSRSLFLEDGQRLFNIGILAPDAIWASVQPDFDQLLGAFTLDDVQGITAAPLRQMSSEPAIDLSAVSASPSTDATDTKVADEANASTTSEPSQASDEDPAAAVHHELTKPADVALADDAATLDPDHIMNVRLRDGGAGLVPRVLSVVPDEKYAVVGAAAVESIFRVPFGWHVIDDGRRTLIFDVAGGVQINLNLRRAEEGVYALLTSIGDELASENPQAQFLKLDLFGFPCLAIRDLEIEGEQLDQAYIARPSHRESLVLVCRVTATRADMTRALNTAEVVLRSMQTPADGIV